MLSYRRIESLLVGGSAKDNDHAERHGLLWSLVRSRVVERRLYELVHCINWCTLNYHDDIEVHLTIKTVFPSPQGGYSPRGPLPIFRISLEHCLQVISRLQDAVDQTLAYPWLLADNVLYLSAPRCDVLVGNGPPESLSLFFRLISLGIHLLSCS